MPVITLKTLKCRKTPDLEKIAEGISRETGVSLPRFNIFLEQYDESDFFCGSGSSSVIVQIAASESNGKESLQILMASVRRVLAGVLNVKEGEIAVFLQPIESGLLLIDKSYK